MTQKPVTCKNSRENDGMCQFERSVIGNHMADKRDMLLSDTCQLRIGEPFEGS